MAILTNAQPEVTLNNTVTLTNKTLTAPTISDPTFTGTTTNINTTNLVVEDKNIVINDVTSPTDVNADGGGISLNGTTTKTLNWVDSTDAWTSSEHLNLASGKAYYVNGTLLRDVAETLTNKTLTTPVISSITNTGTLTLPTSTDTLVGRDTTDTLTNKTLTTPVISSISNTGTITLPTTTGTLALTSDITVTDTSTSTLSNKTLTAPKFADLGFIADANGNELIILDTVASAVNEVTLANAATGGTPTLTASGGDTNISLDLVPKGTGTVKAGGVNLVTISSTDTLTNKTLTSPTLNDPKINLTFDAETATYTAVLANNGQVVTMDNAGAHDFLIPTNANVAFPVGTQINVIQKGAGQTTIKAVTSGTTTINSTGASATAPKLRARYSAATCIKEATDTWYVVGDIA
jgi:hypothetical protein